MLPISSPFVISVINLYNCNTVVKTLFYGNIDIIFQRSTCDKFNTAFNKAFYTDAVFAKHRDNYSYSHTKECVACRVQRLFKLSIILCLVFTMLTSIASPT